MVKLRTLGECVIEVGENRIAPDSKVVFALLLFLGLERGRRFTRAALIEMFWPDSSPEKASHSLRQTIYQCRKLGAQIEATKTDVQLLPGDVETDFDITEHVRGAQPRTLSREFLPSYDAPFSESFAEWLEEQRNFVAAKTRRRLLMEVAQLKRRGEWESVELVAGELLKRDPLNEEATLVLAEATAMRGNKAGAIKILERFAVDVGDQKQLNLPATILRKRIGDQFRDSNEENNPFVGRSDTLGFLNSKLDLAKHGDGTCLLIWGDPGIGKSRLVSEFHKTVKLQRFQTVKVECQMADANRPLSAFLEAIPALMQLRGGLGCSPQSRLLLDSLISHSVDDTRATTSTIPGGGAGQLSRALTDLIDAVLSETPLVLILEDVHWLDPVSWETIVRLAKGGSSRRFLLVLTSREQFPRSAPSEGCESVISLPLRPLSDSDAKTLFYKSGPVRGGDLAEREEQWFVHSAEGNPYFVRELARHFAETGQTYAIPPSLDSLLSQRLRRISTNALRLLQVCALLGRHSSFERIEKILQTESFKLVEALEDLELHELVVSEGTRVNVRHALLADQAIRLCTTGAKRFLHRRIAQVLEAEVLDTHSAAVLWACDEQWQLAGDVSRGSRVARSCVSHLMSLGLATEAIAILEHASTIVTDTQERYETLRALGFAYYACKHWARAGEVLVQVRGMSGTVADAAPLEHSEEELRLLDTSWRGELNGLADRGCKYYMTRIGNCLRSTESTPTHRLAALVKGLVFADADFDVAAMDEFHGSARHLLSDDGLSTRDRLRAEMIFETCCGDLHRGVTAARALVGDARKQRQTFELISALLDGTIPLRHAAHFDEAEQYLLEALSIARDRELWNVYVAGLDMLATMRLGQDRVTEARDILAKAADVLPSVDDNIALVSFGRMDTQTLIAQGDFNRARASFAPAEHEFSTGMARARNEVQAIQIILDVEFGHPPNVVFLEDLITSHLRGRTSGKQDSITAAIVVGLRATSREAEADILYREYLTTYRRERFRYPRYLQRLAGNATMSEALS